MFIRWLVFLALLLGPVQLSAAQEGSNGYFPLVEFQGRAIEFRDADIAFSEADEPPSRGWERRTLPQVNLIQEAKSKRMSLPTVWARIRFDRSAAGNGPIAFVSDFSRERMILYLNGVDIYRSFSGLDDQRFGWNHPWFVSLPDRLLKPGMNEIDIRLDTNVDWNLGVGILHLGADDAMRSDYEVRQFYDRTAPRTITGVLAILTVAIFLFWLTRPREQAFGWLAAVGAIWVFRNLHYFADKPPFDARLFWNLTVDSIFLLMVAVYGFAATFLDIPNRKRVFIGLGVSGAVLILVRYVVRAPVHNDMLSNLLAVPVSLAILYILARACLRSPRIENHLMLAAITVSIIFSFIDLGFVLQKWRVVTFFLQPYGSILVFSAFGFALGRRVLVALETVENVNQILEVRVASATTKLAESEAVRRELEVARAVDQERERLMLEIHDGIGSNLVTALTVAKRKKASPETLAVLRRSLTDLKIAVDSLEPIEGDVVLLLASIRHRLEPELREAGLSFDWHVENAPPLPWLDAVGALHVLRLLQEAIGNILLHAGTAVIQVHCGPAQRKGREGVEIIIADQGCGFDLGAPHPGKGLANMAYRAEALRAEFRCESALGQGTKLTLWLPPHR